MAKIFIGFSTPKAWKPFAELIKFALGTPYSHVYIRIPAPKIGEDLIYQASSTMVNFMGWEFFQTFENVIKEFELDISDESKKKLMQKAVHEAGRPYGIKQCVGMGLVILAKKFGKKIKNPFADGDGTYVCSEIGWEVLEDLQIRIDAGRDVATPKDIFNSLLFYELTKIK